MLPALEQAVFQMPQRQIDFLIFIKKIGKAEILPLANIKVPTLVVYGKDDALIPNKILHPYLTTAAVAEAGASLISDAELYLVAEAGHFVQWEQTEKVNTLLRSFIQSR